MVSNAACVEDLMNTRLAVIPARMDIRQLAEMFRKDGVRSAVVVDGFGWPVGVISGEDLLGYLDWKGAVAADQKAWKSE
jgi:predicted transcriptional regulator